MQKDNSAHMSVLEYVQKTQKRNLDKNCDCNVVEYEEARKNIEFYIFELSNTKIKKNYF